jgi:hypothetical protein
LSDALAGAAVLAGNGIDRARCGRHSPAE